MTVSFCLVSLAMFMLAGGTALANEPILLGINYPLTGPYSVEGLDQIRSARMAVDEINRSGGVLGRRLQLLPRDSASNTLITQLNVNELIDAGCTMIFGGSSSAVAVAAADICQQRKVPFFGTLTYSMDTTVTHGHRFSFRECSDSWMAAMLLADWLHNHFPDKRYYFITADYTWGWSTENSLRQVIGVTDTTLHPRSLTPLGQTTFREELQKAAQHQADVLALVLFGKDLAYALRQATNMGLKDRMQIVVPNLTLGMAERTGPRGMQGVVGTLPWTWKVPYLFDSPTGRAFVEAFLDRYRHYPSTSGASAYTIVHEYSNAVERAGSFEGPAVIKALEGHSFSLLKDTQTWRALDHQNVQTLYMVQGNPVETVLANSRRQDYFSIIGYKKGAELALTPEQWKTWRIEAGLPPELEPLEK